MSLRHTLFQCFLSSLSLSLEIVTQPSVSIRMPSNKFKKHFAMLFWKEARNIKSLVGKEKLHHIEKKKVSFKNCKYILTTLYRKCYPILHANRSRVSFVHAKCVTCKWSASSILYTHVHHPKKKKKLLISNQFLQSVFWRTQCHCTIYYKVDLTVRHIETLKNDRWFSNHICLNFIPFCLLFQWIKFHLLQ